MGWGPTGYDDDAETEPNDEGNQPPDSDTARPRRDELKATSKIPLADGNELTRLIVYDKAR